MPRRPHECLARQYGDQMICHACGLNWDTNDPEPPECRKVDRRTKVARVVVEFDTRPKMSKVLPDELPPEVAAEMVKAFRANARDGLKGQIEGMRAAYRVFLDTVEV